MWYNGIKIKEDFIRLKKATQNDKQSKQNDGEHVKEHPDLALEECAKNLGIGLSTLSRWRQQFEANDGDIPVRGSGNYASDEQKEIARLKRELRDTQDALDVLKKAISILGKE